MGWTTLFLERIRGIEDDYGVIASLIQCETNPRTLMGPFPYELYVPHKITAKIQI